MSGLETTGFVPKTADELADELADAQRAAPALGADWDTSAESPGGQLNGVLSTKLAELWELGVVLFNCRDPRGASFAGLDAVCSLTGTTRQPAKKGTVTLTLLVAAGATIPAGSVAAVDGQPSNRWVTTAAAVNSGGSPASVVVDAEAETAGPYVANSGTITVIARPVAGWTSVTNGADAAPGALAETDPVLRSRRERELGALGTSPVDAIRAALSRVAGVSVVAVAENDTNELDPILGMPPHSVMAIVQGGTDAAVGLALWKAKAGGIETVGDTDVTITDASGATRGVKIRRPTTVPAYATVTLVYADGTYPGDDVVKAATAAVTLLQAAGGKVRMSTIIKALTALAGVVDCTRVLLGRSAGSQEETNLSSLPWEVLELATARVTVVRNLSETA